MNDEPDWVPRIQCKRACAREDEAAEGSDEITERRAARDPNAQDSQQVDFSHISDMLSVLASVSGSERTTPPSPNGTSPVDQVREHLREAYLALSAAFATHQQVSGASPVPSSLPPRLHALGDPPTTSGEVRAATDRPRPVETQGGAGAQFPAPPRTPIAGQEEPDRSHFLPRPRNPRRGTDLEPAAKRPRVDHPPPLPPQAQGGILDLTQDVPGAASHGKDRETEDRDRMTQLLKPGGLLNDEIIMRQAGWLRKVYGRVSEASSLFFGVLERGGRSSNDSVVWSATVKVQERARSQHEWDILFIPINAGGSHWALATVDFKHHLLCHYDSMAHAPGIGLKRLHELRRWLVTDVGIDDAASWRSRSYAGSGEHLMPQQENAWDCGTYVARFMEFIATLRGKAATLQKADEETSAFSFTAADALAYRRILWERHCGPGAAFTWKDYIESRIFRPGCPRKRDAAARDRSDRQERDE